MSEWKECKLGALSTKIGSGATPKGGSNSYKDEGISLIRSQNILDFKFSFDGLAFIDNEQADCLKNVTVEKNDILLNITGDSVARCCIVSDSVLPARVNQHVSIIRLNSEKADYRFIFYALQALKEELLMQAEIGATRKALTKGMIENLDIQFPPLPEQRAIASVLSSLDDKIDLLHRQNKTLEAMAETLFRQWFVEEADEGWEEGDIYRLIDVVYGYPFKSKFFNEKQIGLPLIRIRDLKNGYSNIYTNEECEEKHILNCGDLVASMDGEFRLYVWAGEKSVLNQRACKFVPKHNYVPHLYVFSLLKPHLHYYENVNIGTTVIHLSKADIDDIRISIPPKEILEQFGEIVNFFHEKLKNNNNQIRTLEKLRDTLLPKLMSGEVRVKLEQQEAGT